jgi:FlaA1/EpsC-like NDP-sugar epimerase
MSITTKYLFPFKDIPKRSKIAIYGAGSVCPQILGDFKDTSYCDIVCIADSNENNKIGKHIFKGIVRIGFVKIFLEKRSLRTIPHHKEIQEL